MMFWCRDRHNITEILLKLELYIYNPQMFSLQYFVFFYQFNVYVFVYIKSFCCIMIVLFKYLNACWR